MFDIQQNVQRNVEIIFVLPMKGICTIFILLICYFVSAQYSDPYRIIDTELV